jgi:hypothetical protein
VTIAGVKWIGLRCRVTLAGAGLGTVVDLRTRAGDAASTVASEPKGVGADGQVSLAVPDDDRVGEAAVVVALDSTGQIRAQAPTIIGG